MQKNAHRKLVPDPFLILVNNPKQTLHAIIFFLKKDILKEDYQKSLFLLTQKIMKKQSEPGTNDQSLFLLKQVQKNPYISYVLPDQV